MDKDVNRVLNYLTERLEIAINHSKDDEQRGYIRAKGMVNDARRNIGNGMFDYGVADCMNLPFDDNSFDNNSQNTSLNSVWLLAFALAKSK